MPKFILERVSRALCIATAVCLCSSAAVAGELPQKGATLQTTNTVKLRQAPPQQSLGLFVGDPGKETHSLPAGTKVKVQQVDRVKVPFDQHTWVKVQAENGQEGWAYFGNDDKSANFKPK